MLFLRLFVDGWGVINPSEFYFGIGICLAAVLLLATALVALSLLRQSPQAGERTFARVAFALSMAATAGLVLMAAVPCFYPPDETPKAAWIVMALGDLAALLSVVGLLAMLVIQRPRVARRTRIGRIDSMATMDVSGPFARAAGDSAGLSTGRSSLTAGGRSPAVPCPTENFTRERSLSMPRIVRFHRTGGPEVLQIDTLELPPPGPGEVRIAVKALGLNRAEAMFRAGQYLEEPKLPARLGYEAAGSVLTVGPGVTGFNVGDAVSTVPSFSLNQYGVYGDEVNVPARSLVKHPANLSWTQAAAVWMQYLTAYGALVDIAHVAAGDAVVIPAASSSVGIAAIQIVNLLGATPLALSRSSAKRQALLDLGAAHVIATGEQDLVAEIKRLTGGRGARVVFDPVAGPTISQLVAAHGRRTAS